MQTVRKCYQESEKHKRNTNRKLGNKIMNEKINVAELLRKYAKVGEKLYCTMLGDVKLKLPITDNSFYPIRVQSITSKCGEYGLKDFGNYTEDGECLLFPSKDQRDWLKWREERELENQEGAKETIDTSSNAGEKIFAVGDKVYDVFFGWGEVVSYKDTNKTGSFPIEVRYKTKDISVWYTEERAITENLLPRLSFTEYDLVDGGFSQKRPLPNIPMYTPIFVKGSNGSLYLRVFHHWSKENNPVCLIESIHGISEHELMEWRHGYFLELPEDFKINIKIDEGIDN